MVAGVNPVLVCWVDGGPRKTFTCACRAVISNASVWDTQKLLPKRAAPDFWRKEALGTPMTGSFMHLHLGGFPFTALMRRCLPPSAAASDHFPHTIL